MMPFEYTCGCIGMGRSGAFWKVTSGASKKSGIMCVSEAVRCRGTGEGDPRKAGGCRFTDGVAGAELEFESVRLAFVERVVVEDPDVHLPFFQVVDRGDADSWREMFMDLFLGTVRA